MPTLTVSPTSNSGFIDGGPSASYAVARSGSALGWFPLSGGNALETGQANQGGAAPYFITRTLIEFDLSGLPSTAIVTSASLTMTVTGYNAGGGDTAWLLKAAYGTTPGTSYWASAIGGASLTSVVWTSASSTTLTMNSTANLVGYISTGKLQFAMVSGTDIANSPPSTNNVLVIAGTSSPQMSLAVTYHFPAPTVTAIGPNLSQLAGGTTTTITGTGFQNNTPGAVSVTICGITATNVSVVSDTQLTCTIPTSVSAQVGNVVVTTANNGSGTLSNGFTYVYTVDSHVSLIKGGIISGSDKALSSLAWPLAATAQDYGSSSDLWGISLTAADVNAANFGVALSANTGAGTSHVESVQVTVYYSVASNSQPGTYLMALVSDVGGDTVTPQIYKLPNSGFSPGLDNNIQHAVSAADFYTSRLHLPSRNLLKAYRCIEFWCDLTPSTNTPGLQVWAAVDNGAFSQLLDANGNAVTITASGAQRLFFPVNTTGHFVQLDFKVPAITGGQVPVAVTIRDVDIRVSLRAVLTDAISATLVLGQGQFQDRTTQVTLEPDQLTYLKQQLDAGPVVAYRDPVTGAAGQMLVTGLTWQPVVFPGENNPTLVAHLTARKMRYSNG